MDFSTDNDMRFSDENEHLDIGESMFSRSHRNSILKPPKVRGPLQDVNLISSVEIDVRKKRVSFAGVNKVREFNSEVGTIHVSNTPSYDEIFSTSDSSDKSLSKSWQNKTSDTTTEEESKAIIDAILNDDSGSGMDITDCSSNDSFSNKAGANTSRREEFFNVELDEENLHDHGISKLKSSEVNNPVENFKLNNFIRNSITTNQNISVHNSAHEKSIVGIESNSCFKRFSAGQGTVLIDNKLPPVISGPKYPEIEQMKNSFIYGDSKSMDLTGIFFGEQPQANAIKIVNDDEMDITQTVIPDKILHFTTDISKRSSLMPQKAIIYENKNYSLKEVVHENLPETNVENDMDITQHVVSDRQQNSVCGFEEDMSLEYSKIQQKSNISYVREGKQDKITVQTSVIKHQVVVTNPIGDLNMMCNVQKTNDWKVENKKSLETKDNLIKLLPEPNTRNLIPNVSVEKILNADTHIKGHSEFNDSTDMEFTEAVHMKVKLNENKSFEKNKSYPLKFGNLNDSSDMEMTEACALGPGVKPLFNNEMFKNLISSDVSDKVSTEADNMNASGNSKLRICPDVENNEFAIKDTFKDQRNEINVCSKKVSPDINLKIGPYKGTSSNLQFTESLGAKPLEDNENSEDSSEMEFTEACFKNAEILKLSDKGNTSNMEFTEVLPSKQVFIDEGNICMNMPACDLYSDMEFTEAITVPVKSKINDQLNNFVKDKYFCPDKSDNKSIDGEQFKKISSQMDLTTAVGLNNSNKFNNIFTKDSNMKEQSSNMELTEALRLNYSDKNENNAENCENSPNFEAYLFNPFDKISNKETESEHQSNMDLTEIKYPAYEVGSTQMKCPEIAPESNQENMNITTINEGGKEQSSSIMELTEAYGIKPLEKNKNCSYFGNSSSMELTEGCVIKLKGDKEIKSFINDSNLLKNNTSLSFPFNKNNSNISEFTKQKYNISSEPGRKESKSEKNINTSLDNVKDAYNKRVSLCKNEKLSNQSFHHISSGNISSNFMIQKDISLEINDEKEANKQSKLLVNEPDAFTPSDEDSMEFTEAIDDLALKELQQVKVNKEEYLNAEDECCDKSVDSGSMDITQCCSKINITADGNDKKNQISVFVDDEEEINYPKISKEKSQEVTMNLNSSEVNKIEQRDQTLHMDPVNLYDLKRNNDLPTLEINSGLIEASLKDNDIHQQYSECLNSSKVPDGSSYLGSCSVPNVENICDDDDAATEESCSTSEKQTKTIRNQNDNVELINQNTLSPAVVVSTKDVSMSLILESNISVDENLPEEKQKSQEYHTSCDTSMDIIKLMPKDNENINNSDDERLIQSCNKLKIDTCRETNLESLKRSFNNMKLPKRDSSNLESFIPSKIPKLIPNSCVKSSKESDLYTSSTANQPVHLPSQIQNSSVPSELSESLNQIRPPNPNHAVGSHLQSKFNSRKNSTLTLSNKDSFHISSESLVVGVTKEKNASSIFNTPHRKITQDLETLRGHRHVDEYKCNVQNLKFMKSLLFDRISYTQWRYNLTKTLSIAIEVPGGVVNESTNLNTIYYKLNNNKLSEPLNLYVADNIKTMYPENWLRSTCQTIKDVTKTAAIIMRNRLEMEKFYETLFYLFRFYPCNLSENSISFYIVDIKAGIKFDIIISLRGFKKITSKDIKVINQIGNVREQFVRSMFDSITDDKKRLVNFVKYLINYCKNQRSKELQFT
ncbi:hypothetical protein O3M35_000988 [Rhynocoris fuscipes]|uniref:Uncharacterized protein n=1 Tax=Rhynocoris fuscipes TaxID=488301 RepID=A0AAW1DQQ0_9HEMI